jgi:hypothetical protein
MQAELLEQRRRSRKQRNRSGWVPHVDEAMGGERRRVSEQPAEAVDVSRVEARL